MPELASASARYQDRESYMTYNIELNIRLLKAVALAASTEQTRYYLNGVQLRLIESCSKAICSHLVQEVGTDFNFVRNFLLVPNILLI